MPDADVPRHPPRPRPDLAGTGDELTGGQRRRRATTGNLPAELTSFVGRRREVGEVTQLLRASRLVTLTGVGGVGKTRLSLRVATAVRRAFPDGVWFADLSVLRDTALVTQEVHDPELLAHLVAVCLGVREQSGRSSVEALTAYLTARHLLLVLDNCEHLIETVATLADALLSGCGEIRLLATSREPLGILGEALYTVPPLTVPEPPGRAARSDLAQYESVALFVARGEAILGFPFAHGHHEAVAEICRRLDGLPLAIELAAARLRVLAAPQLLERLSDQFTLLTRGSRSGPERQQTLRACVDWSFELCSKTERILWSRLSVFAGDFQLDAVEGVCADDVLPPGELLDVLAGLVDKSILITNGGEPAVRYRMLEVLRAYGAERLVQAGELARVHGRHSRWYGQLVMRAHEEWIGDRQAYWLSRLGREHANIRAAIEFCLVEPDGAETALQITLSVPTLYWWAQGRISEGRRWLDLALAQARAPGVDRAGGLLLAAHLAIAQGDVEVGQGLQDAGADLAGRLGARHEIAYAVHNRGLARLFAGDLLAAVGLFEEALDILAAEPASDPQLRLNLLHSRGVAAALIGDHERVVACHTETLTITDPVREGFYRSKAMWFGGLSFWRQGDLRQASEQGLESLRIKQSGGLDDQYGVAQCVELLAWTAAGERNYRRAATLLGSAAGLRAEMGIPTSSLGHLIAYRNSCEQQSRAALGDQLFAESFGRGRQLTCEEALSYALRETRAAPPAASGRRTPLTRREQQIAELVAQGMSNRDIAAALVISQRTAESHIEHILAKLGFASRALVAAWVTQQEKQP